MVMTIYCGFDTGEYPGDELMQLLRTEAQMAWTGFYLAPAPSHHDTGWMDKRSYLNQLGYGFAPVYLGQQQSGPGSHILTAAQGSLDGANAAELARQAGFPAQSVLYLDIETGPPAEPEFFDYYQAWVQGVIDSGFQPGMYCSHLLASDFLAKDDRTIPWVFQLMYPENHSFDVPMPAPDPSQSTAQAKVLQYAQNCTLVVGSTKVSPVDLDSALMPDPSVSSSEMSHLPDDAAPGGSA